MSEKASVTVCSQCSQQRGKSAKPWRNCSKCNAVLCLICAPARRAITICRKCWGEEWQAEEKLRKETPVECRGCHKTFLPEQMENPYVPTLCKSCHKIPCKARAFEAQEKRKRNARPGLVEVDFGIHEPKEDGGEGYAYRNPGLDLQLGDVVLLPATWLDRLNGMHAPKEGTVISTYSDYHREVQSIIKLVRKANKSV